MLTYTHMKTRTTRSIISGKNALSEIPRHLSTYWPSGNALIFADTHTWKAAGEMVSAIISDAGYPNAGKYIFPNDENMHADLERIASVAAACTAAQKNCPSGTIVPIAVGSGTVNDIVKRGAFELDLPYVCVPTAPSVDGYTSFGSAVTVNGFKTTLPCDAPWLVVADQDIMAAAPYELIAAGYGDLAAKLTSGRDWLIAEALGLESIDPAVWHLSQGKLLDRLSRPETLVRRDAVSVRDIFEGLCDTGLAMQDQGDSRPASGAEHHISHCWEMRGLRVRGKDVLHGEKVAAGTRLMALFAEVLFSFTAEEVKYHALKTFEVSPLEREREIRKIFADTGISEGVIGDAVRISLEKLDEGQSRLGRLEKICGSWNSLRSIAFADRPSFSRLSDMFSSAHCPGLSAIGIDSKLAAWGLLAAQTIRNRYTLLDLAWDIGVLEIVIGIVITKINTK